MVHSSLRKLYIKLLVYGYKILHYKVEEDSIHLILKTNNPWDCPEELIVYKNIQVRRSGLFDSDKKHLFMDPYRKDPMRGWK